MSRNALKIHSRKFLGRIHLGLVIGYMCAANPIANAASSTIWDRNGQLVVVNRDAVAGAPNIGVFVNGAAAATGNQLVMYYDVDPLAGQDFRQAMVIDTNGFMRLRHLDGNESAASADKFGTSIKLPPGLILIESAMEVFYLSSKLQKMDLIASNSSAAPLVLAMSGSSADGQGRLAPVNVSWRLTLPTPTNKATAATLDVATTFTQLVNLSSTRVAEAQAFQSAMFSSSNMMPTASYPSGTHDADQLRVIDAAGRTLDNLNLNTAPRGQLLYESGLSFNGSVQLNQLASAPLNGDSPCMSIRILSAPDHPDYFAQGYIASTTDPNSDNMGVWINRTFGKASIAAGSHFAWSLQIIASDEPDTRSAIRATVWVHY